MHSGAPYRPVAREPRATGIAFAAALLLCGAIGLATVSLRQEWQVRQSETALEAQTTAMMRHDRMPAPRFDPIPPNLPPRAQVHRALYEGRAAQFARSPGDRARMLNDAVSTIGRATAARPRWGEAWTVATFIYALHDGPRAARTQSALARSYAGTPFLRYSAQWRVGFALATEDLLSGETRARVIDEGIWIARIEPRSRKAIFDMFRPTPAYERFLLRWRAMRLRDADIAYRRE
ncbi:MAG: hypothetical protein DI547_13705 [Sphingobium sp.]|nr:MAG: hypothetical protein DI547_13705 [Sphingobium sp.]